MPPIYGRYWAMNRLLFVLPALVLSVLTIRVSAEVDLVREWSKVTVERPVWLAVPPDGTERNFLVSQRGKIHILPADRSSADSTVFLDFSGRAMEENKFEEGLLNLTFHPDFKTNRKFFVFYTQQNPKVARISELTTKADDPDQADLSSERILLEIPQPFWNHNSGNMLFGPDGMLYIAVGDGGKKDGKFNLSQNLFMLNGKILRIDVNKTSGRLAYGIPADNPMLKTPGARPEIYAWGMRNPWGLVFDKDGALWCADVGQERWEEINIIKAGGNYGWNFREGNEAFVRAPHTPPEKTEFIDPVFTYDRTWGISITGGEFYKGEKAPSLKDRYLFADWGTGTFWSVAANAAEGEADCREFKKTKGKVKPTAFCTDSSGETIVLAWDGKLYSFSE